MAYLKDLTFLCRFLITSLDLWTHPKDVAAFSVYSPKGQKLDTLTRSGVATTTTTTNNNNKFDVFCKSPSMYQVHKKMLRASWTVEIMKQNKPEFLLLYEIDHHCG
jgi:hypothetical protein